MELHSYILWCREMLKWRSNTCLCLNLNEIHVVLINNKLLIFQFNRINSIHLLSMDHSTCILTVVSLFSPFRTFCLRRSLLFCWWSFLNFCWRSLFLTFLYFFFREVFEFGKGWLIVFWIFYYFFYCSLKNFNLKIPIMELESSMDLFSLLIQFNCF